MDAGLQLLAAGADAAGLAVRPKVAAKQRAGQFHRLLQRLLRPAG